MGWLRCHSLKVRKVLGETWLAGVDGCRAGWIAAFVRPQGGEVRLRVVPRFAEVTAAREAPAIIAVDIPIGLPEQAVPGGGTPRTPARSPPLPHTFSGLSVSPPPTPFSDRR